jgi:tRNA(Arg) A34 adenosine deaminase TadA
MLWANIDRVYYILEEKDSDAIGFGDRHFYDEVGRPLEGRQIIPMIRLPELEDEAMSVYRLRTAKHGSG